MIKSKNIFKNIFIIIMLITLLLCITKNIKNKYEIHQYKDLYDFSMYASTIDLFDHTIRMGKELSQINSSGKINNMNALRLKQYSDEIYDAHYLIKSGCIRNSYYLNKCKLFAKGELFIRMQVFCNYIQLATSSSHNNEVIINKNKNCKLIINTLTNICNDINNIYYKYKSKYPDNLSLEMDMIATERWITIMNNIDTVFIKYEYTPKELDKINIIIY